MGGNFALDPRFCSVDPLATGDFSLRSDSPCAPGNHPDGFDCGRIGAVNVQCQVTDVAATLRARLRAWPNPTAGAARIDFGMPIPGDASLALFDVRGRCVRSMAIAAGGNTTSVLWDGLDSRGRRLAPGVYFVQLRTVQGDERRKLVVIGAAPGGRE
jgi:hypothetical protein